MTLTVSLRIPDGIVIAGDSLSTTQSQIQVQGQIGVTCPNCGHQHDVGPLSLPPVQMPTSTFSYAQKVFPFMKRFGVGTFGLGLLMNKTMYFAMRELQQEIKKSETVVDDVSKAADIIGKRGHELVKGTITDLDQAADDWYAVGFHVVGYDGADAKSIVQYVGKEIRTQVYDGPGCTYAGQGRVVKAIWDLYGKHPEDQAAYPLFSLEDAISYAEFLIRTTSDYQQFSRSIPQVGGAIDVALVTPFDDFRWIKQKPLARILGDEGNGPRNQE